MAKFSTNSLSDVLVHVGIVIAAGLILLFSFFFVYLPWKTNHGNSITVPDLKGMSVEEMEKALDDKNLDYEISDSTFVVGAKPLTVYSQYPKPSSNVKEGRKIYITIVSDRAPMVSVPDIVGRSFESAKNQLVSMGLVPNEPEYIPALEENTVLKIKVEGAEVIPGRKIPKGSKVTLVVGDGFGNQKTEVPDLIGDPLEEAEIKLNGVNLNLGSVIYQNSPNDAPGTVLKQKPAPGTAMKSGQEVNVWVVGEATEPPPPDQEN